MDIHSHETTTMPAFALGGYAVTCSYGRLAGFAHSSLIAEELGRRHMLGAATPCVPALTAEQRGAAIAQVAREIATDAFAEALKQ